MAFVSAKDSCVLVDKYNLSPYFNSYDRSQVVETLETTCFGASAKAYIPGLKDGTLSLAGLYDPASGAVDEALAAALGASAGKNVSLLPAGAGTIGNRAFLLLAHETDYTVSGAVADLVTVSAEFQASGGIFGAVGLTSTTAITAAGNQTSVDNSASSANGWVANLHLVSFTGTNITAKIQHSSDNSTFADLTTFTQLTAAGSEQKTATGTVNRYARVNIAGTFTSAVILITFARL